MNAAIPPAACAFAIACSATVVLCDRTPLARKLWVSGQHDVERRLLTRVLDRDDRLVRVARVGENPEVLQDHPTRRRHAIRAAVTPFDEPRESLARTRQRHVQSEQISRDSIQLTVTAAVVPEIFDESSDVRDVLELRIPWRHFEVRRHLRPTTLGTEADLSEKARDHRWVDRH
jgi:hypothetical protein